MKKRLTKTQLKRIALATEAMYIYVGNDTAVITDFLYDADRAPFEDVQMNLASKWFKQAGFDEPVGNMRTILIHILGPDYKDYFFADPCERQ